MSNELQIRLTADIAQLQSALTKAKNTIKSFESETEKESEKGNVGFKRKIGLIEQLTNKAKALRTALSQATNEKQIEAYNQELENTSKELTRLNALGRTITANLSGVGGGFNRVATSGANANGVALEFNRIIQDAPFGLIGIGNNLQQLAGNFAQVNAEAKKAGGTVGTALKASLTSIISPVNLGLLAISALTAGFTAYQMGAFDFVTATDEAKTAQEEFNESLKDTEQTLKQGFFNELLKAQGLLKQENLGGRLIDVPAFQTADEVLQKLAGTIDGLNKNELEALESFLSQRLADAARASANATTELEKSLAGKDVIGYEKVLAKVNEQLKFYEDNTKKSTKATKDSIQSWEDRETAILKNIAAQREFNEATDPAKQFVKATGRLTGEEGEDATANAIAEAQAKIAQALAGGPPVKEYVQEAEKIKEANNVLVDSFSALGIGIASSLDISNNAFKGFVTTVLSAAPKLIAAIIAQAQANKAAAEISNQANLKQATGNAIVTATSAAKGLGPIGLAALPIFIGGALALISSAFGKSAGGSSSGGAAIPSGAPPQIFTNAQAQVPNQFNPDLSGFSSGFVVGGGTLEARVDGDDLLFVLNQAGEKRIRR